MKLFRFILGAGVVVVTISIGHTINYIYSGILLLIGAILVLTSFFKDKR
ncbi:hypothetical protein LCGC14_0962140 [marine sediment metagenome]|uniref:Uncharacterized protein n=1 Tax=marine sediment metagenome TaxID=412755 RepID=A0A0F9QXC3_9ZZZZ